MAAADQNNGVFKAKYKYNLNHRLFFTPRQFSVEEIILRIHLILDIPPEVFDRDRFIAAGERSTIPFRRLCRYAVFFNCAVTDLRNTPALRVRTFIRNRIPIGRVWRRRSIDLRKALWTEE